MRDPLRALAAQVAATLDGRPVDVIAQARADRRKKLFLADMDSTMIGQECIDELADFVGMKAHVSEITERAMRGEIAFEPALRERVALLKGLEEEIVAKVIADKAGSVIPMASEAPEAGPGSGRPPPARRQNGGGRSTIERATLKSKPTT